MRYPVPSDAQAMKQRPPVEWGVIMRWALSIVVALGLCAAPLWLWGDAIRWFFLKLDDFVYIARSRDPASLSRYLLTPHNAHIVPLFLIETHVLARLAGSLRALPHALGLATYVTLVLAMATAGHIVAWETGRPARGLAAMAAVGLSSVLGPAVLWYSAGQALAAGTVILFMLAALQAWRARGGWLILASGVLAAAAAPLFWSGGYTAGLTGLAYLWADGRRSCRRAALLPLAASGATALLVWIVAGRSLEASPVLAERPLLDPARVAPAMTHTAQAICEALVLKNVGLDAPTEAAQGLVLIAILAVVWARSKQARNPSEPKQTLRVSPLEAAGAVLVVSNFAMVFAVRGTETSFDNLRALGWYDAIPHLGAVLFVAGWCSWRLESPPPRSLEPPRVRALLAVAALAGVVLLLQAPRAQRVVFQYDGAAAPSQTRESSGQPSIEKPADLVARARTQRRELGELDRLEAAIRQPGSDRAALDQAIERVRVAGMPERLPDLRASNLLLLPENHGPGSSPRP
jgi:hypothetical protein